MAQIYTKVSANSTKCFVVVSFQIFTKGTREKKHKSKISLAIPMHSGEIISVRRCPLKITTREKKSDNFLRKR